MSMQEKLAKIQGKWVYIWLVSHILGGDVDRIVAALKDAGVAGVALKVCNGTYSWFSDPAKYRLLPMIAALKKAGIQVIFWGYNYIRYNPVLEANVAADICLAYQDLILAYLVDAEGEAKGQPDNATKFMTTLRARIGGIIPIGLNSYRFPSVHPEFPWAQMRPYSDFDCPQVYWRNGDPDVDLTRSMAEFDRFTIKLPYIPAGDMYSEFGIKPTAEEVGRFLRSCRDNPGVPAAIMWSMDDMGLLPELWQSLRATDWPTSSQTPTVEEPDVELLGCLRGTVQAALGALDSEQTVWTTQKLRSWAESLIFAPLRGCLGTERKVTAERLNVRSGPGTTYPVQYTLSSGTSVRVYAEQSGWGLISPGGTPARWVSLTYLA